LPDGIKYFQIEDVKTALDGCDLIICGVSSFGVEWFSTEILPILPEGIPVLSVTKGVYEKADGSLQYFPEFLTESLPAEKKGKIPFNAIGGPCTSYELMDRHQTMVFFCGKDQKTLEYLRSLLETDYYHIGTSTDIAGVEMCVALKNAYAVAVSMAIGLGEKIDGADAYMYNPQAAIFGQSIREMSRLVRLFGGNPAYAGDLPGAGDLFVTIFGGRTRKLGVLLGLGKSYAEASKELQGVTLESVVIITRMSRALRRMAAEGKIDLADYQLILFLDSVINAGAPADFPWEKFR
jgi:glycerol-3-phosphate dehydrogenase (NAD(P)+)